METPNSPQREQTPSLEKIVSVRGTIMVGYLIATVFVLTFIIWGGTVPITSAAIATGVVGVEGHKKQIQHLDGGIVSQINVRDGDTVKTGQSLLVLNDIAVRTEFDDVNNQYIKASAEYARWSAEASMVTELTIPEWLSKNENMPGVHAAMARQSDILTARSAVLQQAKSQLIHKLNGAGQDAEAARSRIENLIRTRKLIESELAKFTELRKNGLATRSQLFDLEKQLLKLDLDIGDSEAAIELAKRKAIQYNTQISELETSRVQQSSEEAAAVLKELDSLKQLVAASKNQLERATIKAPISGYVINSVVNTVGGVVPAGDTIMEILPKNERLLINGRVPPKHRDSIRIGQRAEIRFSAFSRRSTLPVEGIVKLISADSVIDPSTSLPYYSTTIELTSDPSDALNGELIFPGMQADILIITGAQTLLEYLASPITRSFNRALRES